MTVNLGTLTPGDPEKTVTWHVTADPRATLTTLSYSVTANGSNSTASTLSRQIAVPAAPTPECPTVFIGVRGSGETEADSGGLGSTIQTVANTFASVHPRTRIEHVNYMAVAVGYGGSEYGKLYNVSVDDGRTVLKAKISKLLRDCATSKLVLAGFSQGAHVVGDVFQDLKSSPRSHVAAVILLGDPRFNKKQKDGVNVGDFLALNGVYDVTNTVRNISGNDLTSRVRSYCTAGDPVCNFWLPDAVSCGLNLTLRTASCPHVHYVERGWADKAAFWAAGKINP